jgi:hypothetical protein
MCTGASFALYAMAASAAVSTISAIAQGEQQKKWADYQARQAEADAAAERSAAEVHAEKIRKMARTQAGEANASLAGSGVEVGEGTAMNINKDIYANAEEDAVMTIFGGADRAARGNAEAAGYRIKGRQAQQAGYLNAASTILGAAGSIAKGWKQGTNATTPGVGGNG